jgi:hypothetical protein
VDQIPELPAVKQERKLNANPAFQDNANDTQNCSAPYQMSLVDAGSSIMDVMQGFGDIKDELKQLSGAGSTGAETTFWSFSGPVIYVGKLLFSILANAQRAVIAMIGGVDGKLASIANNEVIFNILNMLCMGGLRKHRRILTYANDLTFPVGIPSPSEAAAAWLGKEIDDCTFEAYVMAGDMKFPPFLAVTRAQKYKFSALELMTLHKRKKLVRGDIAGRIRELGSLEGEDSTELESLFTQIPGPAELIRYMVRDTANEQIATTFRTDDQFTENFQGQIKEWADMQGLTEEYMRNEWRAHWGIPAPTQLYVMLHRYRKGGDPNPQGDIEGDIKKALIQQDILPYWVDRLIGVAYHPLTRTDLFRAYEKGWIDDDTFLQGMYHNGYSDDDSQQLLKFAGLERRLAIRNSDFMRAYVAGDITLAQVGDWAEHEGYDAAVIPDVTDEATFRRPLREQADQIREIARRFRECLITEDEARQDATELGIPDEVTDYHLEIAGLNTRCGTARIRATTLCQALEDGNITAEQYVDELRKNRYSDVEIDVLVGMCQTRIRKDAVKRALAQQKAADREARAEAAAEEKARKEAERERSKAIAVMTKLERGRQARQKLLTGAVAYLEKNIPGDTTGFDTAVQQTYNMVMNKYGLTQNESAQAVYFAAQAAASKDLASFAANADAIAAGGVAGQWVLSPSIPLV